MTRTVFAILVLFALLAAAPVSAEVCSLEVTPAATLLLPYFEVNLATPTGITTVISVNNASSLPVLAKGEVWSDLGVPVFGFFIYLKAYDVQTINLRDILVDGILPQTGPATGYASCTGVLPPATIPAATRADYRLALTGKASALLGGKCAGRLFNDKLARGYITFDTMNVCTTRYVGDPGFWGAGGTGDASNQNVLWGDFVYVDQSLGYAQGFDLVHLEAKATETETSTAGQYTFYGAQNGWTGLDNREPLPTLFGVRYLNGSLGAVTMSSDLIVWRDPKVKQSPFTCPVATGRPAWYPLGQERIEIGDETGLHYRYLRKAFPAVAQRVRVGRLPLAVRYPFGWMQLNLNLNITAAGANPPEDPDAAQAWVGLLQFATIGSTRMAAGFDAMQYDSACDAHHGFP